MLAKIITIAMHLEYMNKMFTSFVDKGDINSMLTAFLIAIIDAV